MPFPATCQPIPYTRQQIEAQAKGLIGVYGIFNRSEWIYIGKGDIRARMLAHFDGDIPCINNHRPVAWYGFVTNDADRLEKILIREYSPCCNQRIG